jgi:hypothetical protein
LHAGALSLQEITANNYDKLLSAADNQYLSGVRVENAELVNGRLQRHCCQHIATMGANIVYLANAVQA